MTYRVESEDFETVARNLSLDEAAYLVGVFPSVMRREVDDYGESWRGPLVALPDNQQT
jgi:hypothetical protein